jgi:hypothetical protein
MSLGGDDGRTLVPIALCSMAMLSRSKYYPPGDELE